MAGTLGIRKIAEALGVSMMTVSRALRDVEGVSPQRRAEVLRVAKELGYRPNRAAQALVLAHSNLICISLPTLYNDVFADMLEGMRRALDKAGLDAVLDVSSYDPQREAAWVERMLEWRPAGVVLTGVDHAAGVRDKLRGAGIPTIEIWDVTADPIDLCVGIDHQAAGRLLGDHLAGLGYRDPAFVGVPQGRDPRAEKRLAGLSRAFPDAALPVIRVDLTPSFEAGREGVRRLIGSGHKRPDVICFLNDHMAFGGLCGLELAGIAVPDGIGIAGFNALGLAAVLPRPLTTVETPRREMGRIAAERLIARLNNVTTPALDVLPSRLLDGATTRRQGG